jgi:flagellar motor switch protein FliG
LECIRSFDGDLAQKIMDKMFVFETSSNSDAKSVQMVLESIDRFTGDLPQEEVELRG